MKSHKSIMEEVIHDIFYANASYRAKLAIMRTLTELLVRKIINFPDKEQLMLGNAKVGNLIKEVEKKNQTQQFLQSRVSILREIGNDKIHTKNINITEEEEYVEALQSLLDLMAYPFIQYFCHNKFSDFYDVKLFSVLPPELRVKVLSELVRIYPNNIFVWHKLALAILKSEGKEQALKWIEKHELKLKSMKTIHPDFDFSIYNRKNYTNMYDFLKNDAIDFVFNLRLQNLVPNYQNFEQALNVYKNLPKDPVGAIALSKAVEMKELLDFIYQGHDRV